MTASAPEKPQIAKDKGGRRHGSLGTKTRIQMRAEAAAVAGTHLPAIAPTEAKAGISPKDLLLDKMRFHWANAHKLSSQAARLDREADKMEQGPEQDEKREQAKVSRVAMELEMERAEEAATKAAPYTDPKLQAVTQKIDANITVELTQFGEPAPAA